MAIILTTEEWKNSRASMEWYTMERKRIRRLLTFIALLALIGLSWYLGETPGSVVH